MAGHGGRVTLNLICASCSGALPILRRKGSQRGSEWILSKRVSPTISDRPGLLAGGAFFESEPVTETNPPSPGFHQNRVTGFPRPTRKKLAASRRKVRSCELPRCLIIWTQGTHTGS